jgi:hypothetical protein
MTSARPHFRTVISRPGRPSALKWVRLIEPARDTPPPRVVNLMEALRASVDAEKKKAPAPSTRGRIEVTRLRL